MDPQYLKELKKRIVSCSEEDLEASLVRLQFRLKLELAELRNAKPEDIVPIINFGDIAKNGGKVPVETARKVHKRGLLVVKGVLSDAESSEILTDLHSYMSANGVANPGDDDGAANSGFVGVYWSRAQFRARSHPNMLATQRALLNLWSTTGAQGGLDSAVDLTEPMMYADKLRIRAAGDSAFRLPAHLDSGRLERWSDPLYSRSYSEILSGRWEEHSPFEVRARGQADMGDGCSFFRAFQGWTSLSHSGPGDGTLRILPLLKEAIAAVILRPLMCGVDGYACI